MRQKPAALECAMRSVPEGLWLLLLAEGLLAMPLMRLDSLDMSH